MPIRLEPRVVTADLVRFKSVLIVSCPICPAVSLALLKKSPLIEFFKHGLKTGAFEDYVKSIREPLEERNIRTDTFLMRVPHPLMCLWTDRQRGRLLKRAKDFEAVLVLGCHSATHTARVALKDTETQVFQGMREIGLTNATIKLRYPMTVELDAHPLPDELFNRRHRARPAAAKKVDEVVS
jgi:hypothetical protein